MDLPDPGIEPESPALQADSLPLELSGKPLCWDVVTAEEKQTHGRRKEARGHQRRRREGGGEGEVRGWG